MNDPSLSRPLQTLIDLALDPFQFEPSSQAGDSHHLSTNGAFHPARILPVAAFDDDDVPIGAGHLVQFFLQDRINPDWSKNGEAIF